MKALVYTQPNEAQLLERDAPQAEPGDVVLRIDAVGICGSDMHAWHGHDPRRKPGLVLGHEFAGTVLESRHADWQPGQRVTGNPLITCGTCDYCVTGRDNLCSRRTMVGMTRPGAFAEAMGIQPVQAGEDAPISTPRSSPSDQTYRNVGDPRAGSPAQQRREGLVPRRDQREARELRQPIPVQPAAATPAQSQGGQGSFRSLRDRLTHRRCSAPLPARQTALAGG